MVSFPLKKLKIPFFPCSVANSVHRNLLLLFVFVVLGSRYGLQGVGVGGVGGGRGGLEEKAEFQANENQRQSFCFLVTQELQQSTGFI